MTTPHPLYTRIITAVISAVAIYSYASPAHSQIIHLDPGQRGGLGLYAGPNGERGTTYTFGNGVSVWFPLPMTNGGEKLNIGPYKTDRIFTMGASGFAFHGWVDADRDGKLDFPNEFAGRNKTLFYEDDSLYLRLDAQNCHGTTGSVVLTGPHNKTIYKDSKKISRRSYFTYWNIGDKKYREYVFGKYGEGTYRAAFFIDNTCVTIRTFGWYRKVNTYVCNYWEDLNNDGLADIPKELIGVRKRRFTEDESVTIAMLIRSGSMGKHVTARLLDPMGNTISEAKRILQEDSVFWTIKKTVSELTSQAGSGTYRSAFYYDGKYAGGDSFELIGHKRVREVESNQQPPPP